MAPSTWSRRRSLALGGAAIGTAAGLGLTSEPAEAKPGVLPRLPVKTGLDRLVDSGYKALSGQRVGIISNPTGVDRDYRHFVDLLFAHGGVTIGGVFGPEHGFRGSSLVGGCVGLGFFDRFGLFVFFVFC